MPVLEDPVTEYAQAVISGEVLAGKLVRQACARHLRDLESAGTRGLTWVPEEANKIIFFCGLLQHSIGEWAGRPFELLPYQKFILGSLMGWRRADGSRRFRTAYVELARKNGKTTLAAALALYMMLADGEPGAHCFAVATTRDQAKLCWEEAARMVKSSGALRKRVVQTLNNLADHSTGSYFRPLAAEQSRLDGLSVHFGLCDEVHEHPTPDIIQKLNTGTGARRSPLIFEITTAGYNRNSICFQHHTYSRKLLEGIVADDSADSWFAYIATLDEGDRWDDPGVWIKANPSLGVSVKTEQVKRLVDEAKEMPAQQNIILRLNMNVWTEQSTRWLDMDVYSESMGDLSAEELRGRKCYAGLDLARVCDLSALALVFPPVEEKEKWKVLWQTWVPEDDIGKRTQRDRVPYDLWAREGWLFPTEGNTTDFKFIEAAILDAHRMYDVQEVAYDRTFAGELVNNLNSEGICMVEFGQGFLSMAGPTAEFERLLLGRKIETGQNPVARWCASNVTVRTDPAGNIKPDKERSQEKIDLIVAAIMALGRAQANAGADNSGYICEDFDFGVG